MVLRSIRAPFAFILIAISACPTSATNQNDPQSPAACPAAANTDHRHLQGRWLAQLQEVPTSPPAAPPPAGAAGAGTGPNAAAGRTAAGTPEALAAVLLLGPHPELAHSVRGTLQRGGATAQVSGDVDDGDFTLEESINGTNISATWTGQVVEGSCGKEIRGTWNNAHPTFSLPFVLRKQADRP